MAESNGTDLDGFIIKRYEKAMGYYWAASKKNRRWYKVTRSLTVIFGALVTLVASLSSSEIIQGSETVL